MQQDFQFANEKGDRDPSIESSEKQNLTSKQIFKAMRLINEAMEIFLKNDPDSKSSINESQAVVTNINWYKEIYFTFLLAYLAITTCYRSWPQLICGAIHLELFIGAMKVF